MQTRSAFAAGSSLPRPLGDGSPASEETAAQERSGDICQGAGDANLRSTHSIIQLQRSLSLILFLLEALVVFFQPTAQ